MPQCIYCTETKPATDFHREHVIPESFGRFKGALVLHKTVCRGCNQHFGNMLDLKLARGSEEGFQRYRWGVKRPEQIGQFRYDALTFTFDGGGDYQGCLLRLECDAAAPSGFRATPVDQVGFARADGDKFEWLPLPDVLAGAWKSRTDIDPHRGVRIHASDPDAVRAHLESEGLHFQTWREMKRETDGSEIQVVQMARMTEDLLRVVTKIAFNYLAYTHGAAFALRAEFDAVRRFIRYGELPSEPFISMDWEDIVPPPPDAPEGHRAVLHLVTLEHPLNAQVVLAQVTLFSGLRYQIALSSAPVSDLAYSGHAFNVANLSVYQLGHRRPAG